MSDHLKLKPKGDEQEKKVKEFMKKKEEELHHGCFVFQKPEGTRCHCKLIVGALLVSPPSLSPLSPFISSLFPHLCIQTAITMRSS